MITDVKKVKAEYFDEDGNSKVQSLKTAVQSALRYLAANRQSDEELDLIQNLYSHYDRFSKYEHLGYLSFDLVHRQYFDPHKDVLAKEIVGAVNLLTMTMKTTLGGWENIHQKYASEYNRLVQQLYSGYPLGSS